MINQKKIEEMTDSELVDLIITENKNGVWNPIEAVGCASQNCFSTWWRPNSENEA